MKRKHTRTCLQTGRWVATASVLFTGVLLPGRSWAQFDLRSPRTGIEASAHFGYGGFTNGAAFRRPGSTGSGNTNGSFGMQAAVGYRIVPVLSAGIRGTWQFLAPEPSSVSDRSAHAAAVGAYLRFYPLELIPGPQTRCPGAGWGTRCGPSTGNVLPRGELYLGLGLDFVATVYRNERTATPLGPIEGQLSTSGIALPVGLGVDVQLHENLYAGAFFQWALWTAAEICARTNVGLSGCDRDPHEAEGYLFAGVGIRGHFNVLGE